MALPHLETPEIDPNIGSLYRIPRCPSDPREFYTTQVPSDYRLLHSYFFQSLYLLMRPSVRFAIVVARSLTFTPWPWMMF